MSSSHIDSNLILSNSLLGLSEDVVAYYPFKYSPNEAITGEPPLTNTNTTITENGIAVEEGTENIFEDGSFNSTNPLNMVIHDYGGVDKGPYGETTLSSWDNNINIDWIQGNYYTISGYVKKGTNNALNARVTPHMGGVDKAQLTVINIEGCVNSAGAYSIYLNVTDNWEYWSVTYYVDVGGSGPCYFLESQKNGIDTVCFDELQFEQKSFATSFADGTRGGSNLKYPLVFSNNMTFSFKHKPNMPISAQVGQSTSPNIFELGTYYSNASATFWCWSGNVKTYIKGDEGGGWQTVPTHISFTEEEWLNDHHWTLVYSGTTGWETYKVYLDGNLLTTSTLDPPITSISNDYYAFGNYGGASPNAVYRDFQVFNRALTDEEVLQLSINPISYSKEEVIL